jgi:hypothetical protein
MSDLLGLEEKRPADQSDVAASHQNEELQGQVRNGANWFYWIAGLSAINSFIYMSGSDVSFLAGLGFTQLAEGLVDAGIENGMPSGLKIVAIGFNFVVVAMFGLFGYYANKRFLTAFITGIVLYFLDALLVLLLGIFFGASLFSAGFHAFALFFIIRGFLACRTLNSQPKGVPAFQTPPPPPATT